MFTKPKTKSFNKADALISITASQFERCHVEARDILVANDPALDTACDDVPDENSVEDNWYEP